TVTITAIQPRLRLSGTNRLGFQPSMAISACSAINPSDAFVGSGGNPKSRVITGALVFLRRLIAVFLSPATCTS
ncbi:MAG: hypothetical protein KZQ65_12780, partial [Candidatus Thiodiazotropha sp. (ex Gloverina cf. vestifex)]|nr:hypothetical protein [Candidatus Thiodiazotropha sp. (ex Gloverina cf. vestifex)]